MSIAYLCNNDSATRWLIVRGLKEGGGANIFPKKKKHKIEKILKFGCIF